MEEEDKKKTIRMKTIYKALEDGWTVTKSDKAPKTFEFTKTHPKNTVDDSRHPGTRRSVSEPIVKKSKKLNT